MADKTPVRVVFNESNVATGMAEFQTGETVPVANGGTGLASIGSAGQVLKVNAAGNGLEFSGEGDLSITNLVAPSNADLNLRTSGTGGIILNDITISDNAISTNRSNDDFKINASGTGTVNLENLKIGTSGATVTTILDEDNLSSDSATSLATQQSIKAYVDSEVSAVSTNAISQGDSNVTVADSGTGNVTLEVDGTDRITILAATTTTATGHSLVIGAGSNSTAGQIKFLEGTDNGTNGVTLIGPASTAEVTVTLPAATDTLVGKATTDTFTNKTFDVEGTGNSISNIDVADLKSGVLDTDLTSVSGSDDTLASAKAIKTYVDAQVTAQDLDFATDDSTALNIDLDSETLQVSGGANITTSGSGNTITIALDTALTGLSSVTSTALVTNSISSSDSTAVRIDDALNVDGALDVGAGFTISNTTSVTSIVDEDAMGSDSATALATQQSIKAYVDTQDANIASDTLTLTNKTFDVEATGNSISNIDVADLKSGVLDTDISSVSGSDDTLASAKAIKTYVDSQVTAQDLDFATDDSTALSIDLDSEVLQVSGGANITTSGSGNTITIALDTALTGLSSVTSTALVTNNISSSDSTAVRIDDALNVDGALDVGSGFTISNGTSVTAILDEDAMGSDSATSLATQQSIKAYADTKAVLSGSTNNQITTVTGAHAMQGESNLTFDGSTLAVEGAVTISGDLTVSGDTTTVSTTNTAIADNIIELNTGISQSLNDAGIIIERGSTGNNAAIIWDESADTFVLGTTTATAGDKSGGISIDAGSLKIASLEVDGVTVTDNIITSNASNANLEINANGSGTVVLENLSVAGDGATVTGILDEDAMGSDSDVKLATQQSIKAYADTKAVLSGSTNNTITTVTGAHALQGEANLTFDGSTLAVTGAATVSTTLGVTGASTLDGVTITDNTISTNASNAPLELIANGTGPVVITSGGVAFTLPTSDGSAGQALVTDGAGTLSFDSVSTTISDDTLAQVRNNKHMGTQARSIDSINATLIDSAFYFLVYNDVLNEVVSAECLSITNNDSASFLGNRRGIESAGGSNVPTLTTDVTNGQFRLRAAGGSADCLASFYKIAMSSSTADATRGNTVTTSNVDVDSASESIDTFAHGTYRGAKYFISVDNDSKTEMDVVEALVVHDGTNAFITSYGHNTSGNNPLLELTAAISGDNVVLSAAGLEPNLNLAIHKILLKDNMTAESNANQKAFAAVTVSSSATAVDLMDIDEANGAVYFIVGANGTEGAYSIQEIYTAATPGVPAVANGPYVSTKGTSQLDFTAAFDTSTENSLELFASSTSGGSTTVSGYRISALAG